MNNKVSSKIETFVAEHIQEAPVRDLPTDFFGTGEVRGFHFQQIIKTNKFYLYRLCHPDISKCHYEVFLRKINKRFGVVSYPRSKAFGIWAWTFPTLEQAMKKLEDISKTNTSNLVDEMAFFERSPSR